MNPFSYKEYSKIILHFRDTICNPSEALHRNEFCILRHDIEFSLARALDLAKVENEINVKSTFFVQTLNAAYNPLAPNNQNIIKSLVELNMEVGLHLYISHLKYNDWNQFAIEIERQSTVLSWITGVMPTSFTVHRPPSWFLFNRANTIYGLQNLYGRHFFNYHSLDQTNDISYFADSRHKWGYGHPLESKQLPKVQLCLHPDEWSEYGYETSHNFAKMLVEKCKDEISNFKLECEHFAPNESEILSMLISEISNA